jgi:hypothetical protein
MATRKMMMPPTIQLLIAKTKTSNTNIRLKYKDTKILEFLRDPRKDTITATDFITRADECMGANNWSEQTTHYHFSISLRGLAVRWLCAKLLID